MLRHWSLTEEVIEKKSRGATADHLAGRGDVRMDFLVSVKHPEYGQLLINCENFKLIS